MSWAGCSAGTRVRGSRGSGTRRSARAAAGHPCRRAREPCVRGARLAEFPPPRFGRRPRSPRTRGREGRGRGLLHVVAHDLARLRGAHEEARDALPGGKLVARDDTRGGQRLQVQIHAPLFTCGAP